MFLLRTQMLALGAMLYPHLLALAAPTKGQQSCLCSLSSTATASSSSGTLKSSSTGAVSTDSILPVNSAAGQSTTSPPPLVDGPVVGAWITPWDYWLDADLEGVTDLFVGFVDITAGSGFNSWSQGLYMPTNQQLVDLKAASGTIKRVWAAFGGWGQEASFQQHSATPDLRQAFAQGVAGFMQAYPVFNGIDIDWEFPVDGGADYKKRAPNDTEATTFPLLLDAIVQANPQKFMAVDVPGRTADKKAAQYNSSTLPIIMKHVSIINVMAYDMCNRRDSKFVHHASEAGAFDAVESYISDGVPRDQITVGFPMFGKVFQAKAGGTCDTSGPAALINCDLAVMEDGNGDGINGASAQIRFKQSGNGDLGNPKFYPNFLAAFQDDQGAYDSSAKANAKYVDGYIYSWQGTKAMSDSCTTLMGKGYKGGFAYAAGQDTMDLPRWKAYLSCMTTRGS